MAPDHNTLLERELACWQTSGNRPRLFWRDDDAIEVTPALMRLSEMAARWNIPLLLAVIPKFATDELAEFVGARALIKPAVHGFAHTNHAGSEEKKIELGSHRDIELVLDELGAGRKKLRGLFGDTLSALLVPPWNRIDTEVALRVGEVGFGGISEFGHSDISDKIHWMNTHVDIIDWRGGRVGKPLEGIVVELVDALQAARKNGFTPVGVLSHHLVHDEDCWEMLEQFFVLIGEIKDVEWIEATPLSSSGSTLTKL